MDEDLLLQEKAAGGDPVSIEVLRSMCSELQRKIEAIAQAQFPLNGNGSLFDMQEDAQEDMEDPPLGDSKLNNHVEVEDVLPLPNWQKFLLMEGDTAAGTSPDAKSAPPLASINVPIRFGIPSRPLLLQPL
jgi:hypothetical protein